MIDLQLFKTFLAVLETGSYSAAARKLDYAQPAVTKHIRQLEEAYGGVKLLERQGSRMVPTGAGQGLQSYAAQLLELYEESRRAVSAAGPRTIRLGATYALSQRGIPAAIQRIRALEPGAVLHLTNGNPEVLYRLLRGGQLDLIFVIDRPQSGQGFEAKTIRREETAVLLPPGHPLAGRPSVSFEDIRDERLILTEEGCCFRRLLLEVFAARRKTPNIVDGAGQHPGYPARRLPAAGRRLPAGDSGGAERRPDGGSLRRRGPGTVQPGPLPPRRRPRRGNGGSGGGGGPVRPVPAVRRKENLAAPLAISSGVVYNSLL